jgi:hypothetical protein
MKTNNTYWDQWTRGEIMSLHGVELEEDHDIDSDDMIEEEMQEHHCCGCMDCLGLSWRDFL